jgi:hypothetical protein
MNHFTETTTTSYGENIGNSFKGILFGLFLLLGSIILLSYNENRSINQTLALEEMQSKIITVENAKYDLKYEKTPLLIQGEVSPHKALEDTQFGVKSNGLILERQVEMYQWTEQTTTKSEDKIGGSTETTTTYDYIKEWSSSAINSSSFKYPTEHQNPTMPYEDKMFITDATVGDFHLSQNVIRHFDNRERLTLSNLSKGMEDIKAMGTFLYQGENPNTPTIGDIKITYNQTPQGIYSIVGMSKERAIVPYISQNDRELFFVRAGQVSAHQIFQEEFSSNTMLTWLLRAVGLILMFSGFMLLMGPLATLANVLPMVGSLVSGASAIVAGVLTLIVGSLVIAIAWFASRPILSLIIIGIGIGLPIILNRFKKDKGSFGQNSTTTPPRRGSGSTPPPRR